jgi:hypothetical protein
MRSLLARLAVLGAFAVTLSACSNGSGTSLPFAGAPNGAGGTSGTFQSGSNSQLLLRFLNGSPDAAAATVDVCLDNQPFGLITGVAKYGQFTTGSSGIGSLVEVTGGAPHTISAYTSLGGSNVGLECATAPGPYFGTPAIAVATLVSPASNNVRWTVVLGGTAASGTFGLYIYGEPTFPVPPSGITAVSHNAAPAFSAARVPPNPKTVGFGICTTTVTPCAAAVALTGANSVAAPTRAGIGPTSTINGNVQSGLGSIPAGFYDGAGISPGTPVPITSIAAPAALAGQPYYIQLYAYDGPAGGLNLTSVLEATLGYGF